MEHRFSPASEIGDGEVFSVGPFRTNVPISETVMPSEPESLVDLNQQLKTAQDELELLPEGDIQIALKEFQIEQLQAKIDLVTESQKASE